ncbi:MAG: hypothetical protein ISR65_18285 [Bacteriovoracaceae bacterium]|nr:hypothetical protein [Bacteriovoracaceae bacterium]
MKQVILFSGLLFILTLMPTLAATNPTGIDNRDIVKVSWKEITANSSPLSFTLSMYICGVENYVCKIIKESKKITLPELGKNTISYQMNMSGKRINDIINDELMRKSENYQISVHFYRHSQNSFKELIVMLDIPYKDIKNGQWTSFTTDAPMESYFDPDAFVNTTFEVSKETGPEVDDDTTTPTPPTDDDPPSIEPEVGSGLSEIEYEQIISSIEKLYLPIAMRQNIRLKFIRNWDDPRENAESGFEEDATGKIFTMQFSGGLAKHKLMSKEAYTMVVCHELGHHLGGEPTFPYGGAVEGQADYFASYDCLRRVLINNGELFRDDLELDLPVLTKFFCNKAFSDKLNIKLCQLISYYGDKITEFSTKKKGLPVPRFETPSMKVATKYYEVGEDPHPPYQCRLDTYFAAALCNKHPLSLMISTHMQENDNSADYSRLKEQLQANMTDVVASPCMRVDQFVLGERPICWFIPDQPN